MLPRRKKDTASWSGTTVFPGLGPEKGGGLRKEFCKSRQKTLFSGPISLSSCGCSKRTLSALRCVSSCCRRSSAGASSQPRWPSTGGDKGRGDEEEEKWTLRKPLKNIGIKIMKRTKVSPWVTFLQQSFENYTLFTEFLPVCVLNRCTYCFFSVR